MTDSPVYSPRQMKKQFLGVHIGFVIFVTVFVELPAHAADEREVFFGLPTVKYQVSVDKSERANINKADSVNNAVRIVKIGDEYIWKTRNNCKLVYSYAGYGDFHYLVDPKGSGYVKIARAPGGKITFLEHVQIGMVTITYYGSAQSFKP
jgi:hypothetical protein